MPVLKKSRCSSNYSNLLTQSSLIFNTIQLGFLDPGRYSHWTEFWSFEKLVREPRSSAWGRTLLKLSHSRVSITLDCYWPQIIPGFLKFYQFFWQSHISFLLWAYPFPCSCITAPPPPILSHSVSFLCLLSLKHCLPDSCLEHCVGLPELCQRGHRFHASWLLGSFWDLKLLETIY